MIRTVATPQGCLESSQTLSRGLLTQNELGICLDSLEGRAEEEGGRKWILLDEVLPLWHRWRLDRLEGIKLIQLAVGQLLDRGATMVLRHRRLRRYQLRRGLLRLVLLEMAAQLGIPVFRMAQFCGGLQGCHFVVEHFHEEFKCMSEQ